MQKLDINESFICKIWEGGERFYSHLRTVDGIDVKILSYGRRNYDGGPDYKDAQIQIGERIYSGDVEVHREVKDWEQHNHKKDSKYNAVVLHVAMWNSQSNHKPKLRIKRTLPSVILSQHLNHSIHLIWQEIIESPDKKLKLPCADLNAKVDDEVIESFLSELAVDRIGMKSERMKERLKELESERGIPLQSRDNSYKFDRTSDWEQVMYEYTFEALGYSKNKEPMLKVARNLRLEKIKKILETTQYEPSLTVRSLIYGTSGLLFDLKLRNKYANRLKDIWEENRNKLRIQTVLKAEWQFFRLRPQNFPSVRLAYGSGIVLRILNSRLFEKVITLLSQEEIRVKNIYENLFNFFERAESNESGTVRDYLSFLDKQTDFKIGRNRVNEIIINVVTPLVYLYSSVFKKEVIRKNVLRFYRELRIRQDNSVLRVMKNQLLTERRIKLNTPAMEQGAIQLYNFYCMRERCLECRVGERVFKGKGYGYKIIFY